MQLYKIIPKTLRNLLKKLIFLITVRKDKLLNCICIFSCFFKKIGINIGSGDKFHFLFWRNYDLFYGNKIDANFKINYKNSVFKYCYCSHFIEHCNDDAFINLSKEVYRVLKKGGIFRILVPNFDLLKKAYEKRDVKFIKSTNNSFFKNGWPGWKEKGIKPNFNTWIAHWFANYSINPISDHRPYNVNFILPPVIKDEILLKKSKELTTIEFGKYILQHVPMEYQKNGGHINHFTEYKIKSILSNVGFLVERSSYKNNINPKNNIILNNLDEMHKRQKVTLYINATKS